MVSVRNMLHNFSSLSSSSSLATGATTTVCMPRSTRCSAKLCCVEPPLLSRVRLPGRGVLLPAMAEGSRAKRDYVVRCHWSPQNVHNSLSQVHRPGYFPMLAVRPKWFHFKHLHVWGTPMRWDSVAAHYSARCTVAQSAAHLGRKNALASIKSSAQNRLLLPTP